MTRQGGAELTPTLVVVIERKANKLTWVACVVVSVAFLALSFVVVGRAERWLAVGVTRHGRQCATILFTTIGTMLYWVIAHRNEAKRMRSIKRSSLSRSRSSSCSGGRGGSKEDPVRAQAATQFAEVQVCPLSDFILDPSLSGGVSECEWIDEEFKRMYAI